MFERIIILGGLALALVFLWGLVQLWQRRQLAQLQSQSPFARLIEPGKMAVIAFSTPQCAECRTRQAPALERLRAELGDLVQIHRLSAIDHPDLVAQTGILTVPSTLVLDSYGLVRHLNQGFTDTARLADQLRGLGDSA